MNDLQWSLFSDKAARWHAEPCASMWCHRSFVLMSVMFKQVKVCPVLLQTSNECNGHGAKSKADKTGQDQNVKSFYFMC